MGKIEKYLRDIHALMTTIESLPHELIAIIGDYLLPKWRLRFFLCRKDWYFSRTRRQKALFKWHNRMMMVIIDISNIKYKCVEYYAGNMYKQKSVRIFAKTTVHYTYDHIYEVWSDNKVRIRLWFRIQCSNKKYWRFGNGMKSIRENTEIKVYIPIIIPKRMSNDKIHLYNEFKRINNGVIKPLDD